MNRALDTALNDEGLSLAPKIKRDRWERPLIMPPGGGDPEPYTRCTTVAGTLDDYFHLGRWEKRMVALGLNHRPDLIMAVAGHGDMPNREADPAGYKHWCKEMDSVADAAKEAAKASAPATVGTALHKITERMDLGLEAGRVPEQYLPHLAAYQEATAHFEHVHVEKFLVHDQYKIGGTADRIVRLPGYDKLIIADTKTGNTEFGVGKMAMQLAIYAHSHIYDPDTGNRVPIGNVDLEHGIIVALNGYTGKCEIKWIDLVAAWDMVEVALKVRAWRSRKGFFIPEPTEVAETTPPPGQGTIMDAVDAALCNAIDQAVSADELVKLWHAAGPRWEQRHTDRAAARKRDLAALAGAQ